MEGVIERMGGEKSREKEGGRDRQTDRKTDKQRLRIRCKREKDIEGDMWLIQTLSVCVCAFVSRFNGLYTITMVWIFM